MLFHEAVRHDEVQIDCLTCNPSPSPLGNLDFLCIACETVSGAAVQAGEQGEADEEADEEVEDTDEGVADGNAEGEGEE